LLKIEDSQKFTVAGVVGQNSEKGSPKDHSTIVWAQLAQQFQRRSFLSDFLLNFLFLVTVAILVALTNILAKDLRIWKGH
jgi:hypothetical protein